MNTPVCIGRVTLFLQIYAIMVYWNKRNLQQGADIMGLDDADILDTIYHKAEARLRAQLKAI